MLCTIAPMWSAKRNTSVAFMVTGSIAVDDGAAVRPVLGHRRPDVLPVVIDAARVIDGSLAQIEIGDEVARHVDLEQMPGALAGIAVVAAFTG